MPGSNDCSTANKVDQLAMPGLATLDDATIAAILTYVRRSWGNDAAVIEPSTVHASRRTLER